MLNRGPFGRVLDGPEYFTIFDGETGKPWRPPNTYPVAIRSMVGVGSGARWKTMLTAIGAIAFWRAWPTWTDHLPSVVMCRGVYGRTVMVAWDWREGKLTRRWTFDSGISKPPSTTPSEYSGHGGHSLSVGDVDDDGRDEIVYQAMVVDDDGQGLHSSGLRHGDAMHLADN